MSVAGSGLGIEIKLEDNSPEVLAALRNAIERGLATVGEEAETYAKGVITDEDRVDTGMMLNSISHREGEDFTAVGTNVERAIYQELGTSRGIKPAKFLTRAVTENLDRYRAIFKDSLENA